ncbi:hypothetical protein Q427_31690 [Halomonas sp. BC04]|nr:hypothetical protein Q427_31690 [Halomonas sp. BC04]
METLQQFILTLGLLVGLGVTGTSFFIELLALPWDTSFSVYCLNGVSTAPGQDHIRMIPV